MTKLSWELSNRGSRLKHIRGAGRERNGPVSHKNQQNRV